jgi:hypothetical protein
MHRLKLWPPAVAELLLTEVGAAARISTGRFLDEVDPVYPAEMMAELKGCLPVVPCSSE